MLYHLLKITHLTMLNGKTLYFATIYYILSIMIYGMFTGVLYYTI